MQKGFFVYMLHCADNTLYTGWTTDPDKRLAIHNSGKGAKYTRSRLPVHFAYLARCANEHEARSRECKIKAITKKEKLILIQEGAKMKLVSWNVNGLRACIGKGFYESMAALDADIVCLQETKMYEGQAEIDMPGYKQFWCNAEKRGYSGTLVFSKHTPVAFTTGIGVEEHDHEGRVVTLEYDEFYLVNVYVPNSKRELTRLPYRITWEDAFRAYLQDLDQKKPVIICGDMNVAHEEIDIKNPKTNRKNAGFTDDERACMTKLLSSGFSDTFRTLHPNVADEYTWWSYMAKARERNIGWRIDYFLVSNRIMPQISTAKIHPDITGSDHCPVSIVLKNKPL